MGMIVNKPFVSSAVYLLIDVSDDEDSPVCSAFVLSGGFTFNLANFPSVFPDPMSHNVEGSFAIGF